MPFQPTEHAPVHDIVEVDPETAVRWLNRNENNRRLNDSKVAQYARDMRAGNWAFNGDPVRFDTRGHLLDGQHRLSAIKSSGTTQKVLVVTNLPAGTQDTMDLGRKRAMGDQLQIAGETNAAMLGSVLRLLTTYHAGGRTFSTASPTQAEMRTFLGQNPQTRRAAEVAVKGRTYVPASPSVVGMTYFLAAAKDLEGAELFFPHQLIEGLGLQPGDPALTLQRRFAHARTSNHRLTTDEQVRYVLLAWNAFRDGRKISKLQAPRGGWTADNFPDPK